MHGDSEYYVMFGQSGADICGYSTKKVHVIFNYKGKNHLIKKEIKCKDDELTHLYTLILRPDQTSSAVVGLSISELVTPRDDGFVFHAGGGFDIPAVRFVLSGLGEAREHSGSDAKKPSDWDEDMDGEWEPPMIPQ
ncbi:hypothetical protein ANANG_G00132510 [Anguilla anguilla]|uniref:Uncharacterized protein n=1 Tax=Anguilla anguilla TaxID=7936 RepID=A0A9D3MFG8_ANGAN|nr:hypothetical protein ANANG_G00132510 [Anguilla anguilla]